MPSEDKRDPIDRREFLKKNMLRTAAGWIALSELLGPEAAGADGLIHGVSFIAADEHKSIDDLKGSSYCTILPESIEYASPDTDFEITYVAGEGGLPAGSILAVRCTFPIDPEQLVVTSSCPGYQPDVTIKENIGIPRVIWIKSGLNALPEGESLVIRLIDYQSPRVRTKCAFSVVEIEPDGPNPELGSNYSIKEVPSTGGVVLSKAPAELHVVVPTLAQVNKPLKIRISVRDELHHATPDFTGRVVMKVNLPMLHELRGPMIFKPEDAGSKEVDVVPLMEGVLRVQCLHRDPGGHDLEGESNPCICLPQAPEERVFWGDFHQHSTHCDGNLFPDEIFDYARRFAFLDFGSISPHDMMPYPSRGARNWPLIQQATEEAHAPGTFVTFHAYEWTHDKPFSPHDARGHKVVIFLHPSHLLPLIPYCYSMTEPEYMPATTLFHRLRQRCGSDVIVIPHHLPLYKWWNLPGVEASELGGPLPALSREEVDAMQPVVEVFSKGNGMNESYSVKDWLKSPTVWGWPINFTFWDDALKEGVRAGAACAGDNHTSPLGYPSLTALTAVLAPALDRESVFRAIQKRHTYGTSGSRVYLRFTLPDYNAKMGDIVTFNPGAGAPRLEAVIVSPLPIDYVELIKVIPGHAEIAHTQQAGGDRELTFVFEDSDHNPGAWVCYYLRVHLDSDQAGAWTSPIWIEP